MNRQVSTATQRRSGETRATMAASMRVRFLLPLFVASLSLPPVSAQLQNLPGAKPARPSIEKLIDAGKFDEARQRLREKKAFSGETARDLVLEAMILYREKRHQESINALYRSVKLDQNDPDAFKLISLNLVALNRFAMAGPFIEKAVELAPKDYMAWYYLGLYHIAVATYPKAEPALRKSIELKPDYVDSHTMLGLALENLERQQDAIASYRRAISIAEENKLRVEAPHLYLGRLLFTLDRYEEAVAPLRTAAAINPESTEALKYLGRAYAQLGRTAEAVPVLERAEKLAPEDSSIRYLLMRSYEKLGNKAGAERELKELEELRRKRGPQ